MITPGRWVFVDDATPFYPGMHWLTPRDWTSDDREPWPLLGELQGDVRTYSTGIPDATTPIPVLLGTERCLSQGETYPVTHPSPVVLRGGWDARCPLASPLVLDPADCHFQQWIASVIAALYSEDYASVIAAVDARFPGRTALAIPPGAGLFPGVCIVRLTGATICIMSGTHNELQWAAQFLGGLFGPVNLTTYSTLPIWQTASSWLFDQMLNAGVPASDQLVFAGHSYGAAACAVATFRARAADAERHISLVTLGCPKPGDQRLIDGIAFIPQANLVADGDPVVLIPPTGLDAVVLQLLLPAGVLLASRNFVPLAQRVTLLESGQRREGVDADSLLIYLYRLVVWLLVPFVPKPDPYVHDISNYIRLLVCDGVHPLPPTIIGDGGLELDGQGGGASGIVGDGGLELDGAGIIAVGVVGDGGMELDGAGIVGVPVIGDGGMELDGPGLTPEIIWGDGGMELDGPGLTPEIIWGDGGMELDGAGRVQPGLVGDGGLELDGAGRVQPGLVGDGGLELDGAGLIPAITWGDGGLELDGDNISVILMEDYSWVLEEDYSAILTELPL